MVEIQEIAINKFIFYDLVQNIHVFKDIQNNGFMYIPFVLFCKIGMVKLALTFVVDRTFYSCFSKRTIKYFEKNFKS